MRIFEVGGLGVETHVSGRRDVLRRVLLPAALVVSFATVAMACHQDNEDCGGSCSGDTETGESTTNSHPTNSTNTTSQAGTTADGSTSTTGTSDADSEAHYGSGSDSGSSGPNPEYCDQEVTRAMAAEDLDEYGECADFFGKYCMPDLIDNPINRADAVYLLHKYIIIDAVCEGVGDYPYLDVPQSWYAVPVAYFYCMGWLEEGGYFRPNDPACSNWWEPLLAHLP